MICGISEQEIIKQINNKEIFETICKIKDIDYEYIIGNLINRIQDSDIEDKDAFIGKQETWDSEYIHIVKEEKILFCSEKYNGDLLWSKKEAIDFFQDEYGDKIESELKYIWVETTDKEKEVIKIAQECGLNEIRVEMM